MIQDQEFKKAGASLRSIREAKGKTQEDLAFEAKIDQSTLSKVERLGPQMTSWSKLIQLAESLDAIVEVSFRPK